MDLVLDMFVGWEDKCIYIRHTEISVLSGKTVGLIFIVHFVK